MKVLHINTFARGGAFNGAYRLHKALLKHGVSSKMLVLEKDNKQALKEVVEYNIRTKSVSKINRALTRIGYPVLAQQKAWKYTKGKTGDYEIISFPFSDYDITESKEYKEADIIHLHWIAGFLDFKSFFKKNRKPIVWTLRDSFPFQGIFHLENDLHRNNDEWKKLDAQMVSMKKKYLSKLSAPIKIVGISNNIKNKSLSSVLFGGFEHRVIHNCIDLEEYKKIDKATARKILKIDSDKIVLSFVADSLRSYHKGFKELKEAIEMIDSDKLEVLSVGAGNSDSLHFSVRHRHLGVLKVEGLQLVYAASDAFVFPTKEEPFGNVMLEAMACGTPVIGTPVGGLLDVIEHGFNGLFSKDTSAEGLKDTILEFIRTRETFNSIAIRENVVNRFSEEKVATEYISLYKELIQEGKDWRKLR